MEIMRVVLVAVGRIVQERERRAAPIELYSPGRRSAAGGSSCAFFYLLAYFTFYFYLLCLSWLLVEISLASLWCSLPVST